MTPSKKKIIEDLAHSKDVELVAEIPVFNIFMFNPEQLDEMCKQCMPFSFEVIIGDSFSGDKNFYSSDPEYPLANFKKKTIKLLRLKRNMTVFEIKALAEASYGDMNKLEEILDSPTALKKANFILAGDSRFTFSDRDDQTIHGEREVKEFMRFGHLFFSIVFVSQRPSDEVIEKQVHIAWI